jgi:hypothetical protein
MNAFIDSYGSSTGGRDMVAIVENECDRARAERAWRQSMDRLFWKGTAGVVQVEKEPNAERGLLRASGYSLQRIASSPMFSDDRVSGNPKSEATPGPNPTTTRHMALRMSTADQVTEVMAALNLHKTQCAELLGVSWPTLYDWLDGMEPNAANAERLTSLLMLLADAGVTAADSLSPRFARAAMTEGEPALLDLLKADVLDEPRVAKVLAEAKSLEDEAKKTWRAREDRLRQLGFEEPTAEQRKANLALNVALREWPKD